MFTRAQEVRIAVTDVYWTALEEEMKNPKTIVVIVLVILSFVVFIQNTDVVTLRFLFWELSVSRIILIPFLMLTGFVLGYIVATMIRKP